MTLQEFADRYDEHRLRIFRVNGGSWQIETFQLGASWDNAEHRGYGDTLDAALADLIATIVKDAKRGVALAAERLAQANKRIALAERDEPV